MLVQPEKDWLEAIATLFFFTCSCRCEITTRAAGTGPYNSCRTALSKLCRIHGIAYGTGRRLRFAQTHRLRYICAIELLNDGVSQHVVQRHLGHKSLTDDTSRCTNGCRSCILSSRSSLA